MRAFLERYRLRRALHLGVAAIMGCSSGDTGTEPDAIRLEIDPPSLTIERGGSASVVVTLTLLGDVTGPVELAVSGEPPGVSGTVSDIEADGRVMTATVTITTDAAAVAGRYGLSVEGRGFGAFTTADLAVTVTCQSGAVCEQWATAATASTEYSNSSWSANQATGAPDVGGCSDDDRAWASLEPDGVDWLELEYHDSVHPTEIRIFEAFSVTSIVKVEVRDASGAYHTVHTAEPERLSCPRILIIPVADVPVAVRVVRVSVDQSLLQYWNEIDAVKLIGIR